MWKETGLLPWSFIFWVFWSWLWEFSFYFLRLPPRPRSWAGSQFWWVLAIPLSLSRTQTGSIEFGFTGPRRSSCVLHVKCRESLLTSAVFTFARVKSESFIFICPFLWHAVLRYSVYDSSSPLNHFAGLWHSLTYCPALQRRLCRLGGLAFRLGYVILFSLEFVSLLACLMLNVWMLSLLLLMVSEQAWRCYSLEWAIWLFYDFVSFNCFAFCIISLIPSFFPLFNFARANLLRSVRTFYVAGWGLVFSSVM